MTEFSDWIQNNWFEASTVIVLLALLFTALWFARNVLRTLRASQQQIGALLRLSVSDGGVPFRSAPAETTFGETRTFTAPEPAPEPVKRGPNVVVRISRGLVRWLKTPMGSAGRAAA